MQCLHLHIMFLIVFHYKYSVFVRSVKKKKDDTYVWQIFSQRSGDFPERVFTFYDHKNGNHL